MTLTPWPGDPAVSIEADLLGSASSHEDGKTRWTEIRIYRTRGGTYAVAGVGRSSADGERDLHWLRIVQTPKDALRSLLRRGQHGPYLTNVAADALDEAGVTDSGLSEALDEFESAATWLH